MCTVSWFLTNSGYELFFNRDEHISRAKALPPEPKLVNGCNVLSPIDTEAGGSWISVNQHGLTICLLNLYTETNTSKSLTSFTSRGAIIQKLMSCRDLEEVSSGINDFDLSQYRTFRLLAIDSIGRNTIFIWDGFKLVSEKETSSPKSSSSLDTNIVKNTRKALYHEAGLGNSVERDSFLTFHRGHEPNKEHSVCVHREKTQTVSLSHIVVGSSQSEFNYFSGSPCQNSKPIVSFVQRSGVLPSLKQACVA